jgi:hypothetical protein
MTRDDMIEALARRLCETDGNVPDSLCLRPQVELAHLRGAAFAARYVPSLDGCVPAWRLYAHFAEAAIDWVAAVSDRGAA